jgi:H/ACA ribonucleoprotein complex subunit 4
LTLKQLENLTIIDQDITDDEYGTYFDKRNLDQLLKYGLILLNKPPGPTSHETVAWTKRILKIPKIGHSGTLDPQVSGVLPMGLGEGTKALEVLLYGPKEYHALGRLHSLPSKEKLTDVLNQFTGEIYQKPPQRSAVLRRTRTRTIYELELLEQKERLFLIRVLCEAGTYIRKEKKDDSKLLEMIRPIENALSEVKSVVIRDSAVDALCHGAQLAIPGILEVSPNLKKGDLVAIYTQKGEVVALATAVLTVNEIQEKIKGHAFESKRIIMAPNTYPKNWRTKKPKD